MKVFGCSGKRSGNGFWQLLQGGFRYRSRRGGGDAGDGGPFSAQAHARGLTNFPSRRRIAVWFDSGVDRFVDHGESMDLVWPSKEYLPSYVSALERSFAVCIAAHAKH